jgi:hypothetical protein
MSGPQSWSGKRQTPRLALRFSRQGLSVDMEDQLAVVGSNLAALFACKKSAFSLAECLPIW